MIDPNWKENGISDLKQAQIFLDRYQYSSYLDYCGMDRPFKSILNKAAFPDYFYSAKGFKDFIKDWLNFKEE